jgi:hypothetical protein
VRRFALFNLFVAFAFTVMADPVSSVAYAIEAALDGNLASLPTMAHVVGTIAVVAASYHQVALVLALNLRRLDPVLSLAAAAAISLHLWRTWVRRGRPGGVAGLGSR